MKKSGPVHILMIPLLCLFAACNNSNNNEKMNEIVKPVIKEESLNYSADSSTMHSAIAYDASNDKKRPVVLIIPEWWGLNDYIKGRAKQLAEMGYLAMAVDMYGEGKTADNPDLAGKMAAPFYQNPAFAKGRFDAALAKIKANPMADTSQVAAMGYCFGGGMVLNMARLGEDLRGVVSFHGSLVGVPADKSLLKAPLLICHGETDQFVKQEEVAIFKKQLDSIGAFYTFKSYPGATHAFTNPAATAMGKKFSIPIEYNAAADSASWNDMKAFFRKIFR
ncbi:MAG: dienelactone hydrolase family protein [Ferruginibacter sp.]